MVVVTPDRIVSVVVLDSPALTVRVVKGETETEAPAPAPDPDSVVVVAGTTTVAVSVVVGHPGRTNEVVSPSVMVTVSDWAAARAAAPRRARKCIASCGEKAWKMLSEWLFGTLTVGRRLEGKQECRDRETAEGPKIYTNGRRGPEPRMAGAASLWCVNLRHHRCRRLPESTAPCHARRRTLHH